MSKQLQSLLVVISVLIAALSAGLLILGILENGFQFSDSVEREEVAEERVEKVDQAPGASADDEEVQRSVSDEKQLDESKQSKGAYGEPVPLPDTRGSLKSYVNGELFMEAENVSHAVAVEHCAINAIKNPTYSFKCVLDGEELAIHEGRGNGSPYLSLTGIPGLEVMHAVEVGATHLSLNTVDTEKDLLDKGKDFIEAVKAVGTHPFTIAPHYWGEYDAPLKLAVFVDLDDPFSYRLYQTLLELREEYPNEVLRIQFLHFPLAQLHPNAPKLALAAECFGAIDEAYFWLFLHDIFTSRSMTERYDMDRIPMLVEQYGLVGSQFNQCVEEEWLMDSIDEQFDLAIALGGMGTPVSFIWTGDNYENFAQISGAVPTATFRSTIDALLRKIGI